MCQLCARCYTKTESYEPELRHTCTFYPQILVLWGRILLCGFVGSCSEAFSKATVKGQRKISSVSLTSGRVGKVLSGAGALKVFLSYCTTTFCWLHPIQTVCKMLCFLINLPVWAISVCKTSRSPNFPMFFIFSSLHCPPQDPVTEEWISGPEHGLEWPQTLCYLTPSQAYDHYLPWKSSEKRAF